VLAYDGPVVCAVHMSSGSGDRARATASTRADGTIVSLPMEDMAPRLPREEFLENMMIPPIDE